MDTSAGQAAYNRRLLFVYDVMVLGLTCRFVWKCPSSILLDRYNQHVGLRHLDIGIGTGYFLDNCRFPVAPQITLMDLNPNTLAHCATRLRRYAPETKIGDVMKPLPLPPAHFDSIGMNHLLHCIPGDIPGGKWQCFEHVKTVLKPSGTLFGATVLGKVKRNGAQRRLMDFYNRKGIFGNANDSLEDLEAGLRRAFKQVTVEQIGVVGVFTAREPYP
jgi:SAM-dependent methyltransferase